MKKLLPFCLLFLLFGCKKEVMPPDGDWLMFSAMSVDQGRPVFLLTATELYRMEFKGFSDKWPTADKSPMAQEKFLIARPLLDLPPEMYIVDEGAFGCPGCLDSGYYWIVLKQGGVIKKWTVDPPAAPPFLVDYIAKMGSVLASIQ